MNNKKEHKLHQQLKRSAEPLPHLTRIKPAALAVITASTLLIAILISLSGVLAQGGNQVQFNQTPVNIGTPRNNVWDAASVDLDNDGDLDLVTASSDLEIWRNNGDGTWDSYWIYPGASDMAVGDVDNDGDLDIVTEYTFIVVLQNDGDPWAGSWSANTVGSITGLCNALALADLDNDGDLDLATADQSGPVQAWENDGTPFTGSWASNQIGTVGASLLALAVGDLDNDGDTDVASGNSSSSFYAFTVWENDGSPFSGAWPGNASTIRWGQPLDIDIADMDQDGKQDVVVVDLGDYARVCRNDGSPFSGEWTCIDAGSGDDNINTVSVGDADNDGDLDLLTGDDNASDNVQVWTNDRTPFSGAWTGTVIGTLDGDAAAVALGDLDNDGDLDAVAGNYNPGGSLTLATWDNILIHRSRPGYLPFDSPTTVISASMDAVHAVASADLDNDGDQDFILGQSHGTLIVRNNGSLPWTFKTLGTAAEHVYDVEPADVDRDGDVDLIIGRQVTGDNVQIWINPLDAGDDIWAGSTTWSRKTVGTAVGPVADVVVGHLDHDGFPDIATACPTTTNNIQVWHHDGSPITGTWSANVVGTGQPDGVDSLALGDLNHDGYPDLASGSISNSQGNLDVWFNDGSPFTGTWSSNHVGSVASTVVDSIALADLDGDGNVDLVSGSHYTTGHPNLHVWQNDGSPFTDTWTSVALAQIPADVSSVAVTDLNADGHLDVVAGGGGIGNLAAWRNDGTPFDLSPWSAFPLDEGTDRHARHLLTADVNRDGRFDVVVGSYDEAPPTLTHQLQVWYNVGAPVTVVPSDTAPATMNLAEMDDLLQISATHNGIAADSDVELAWWDVQFTAANGTPLTTTQAQALFAALYVYREQGTTPGFQPLEDTPAFSVTNASILLTDGVQRFTFPDGDVRFQISPTLSITHYLVAELGPGSAQPPRAFRVVFGNVVPEQRHYTRAENIDVDANVLVEAAPPIQSKIISILNDPPLLSSVSGIPVLVKQGTPVTITTTGASDPDGDPLALQCGTSSGSDDLGTGTYGPGERPLTFAAPWSDDLDHTMWCVVTDGILTSTEHTTTITADNTPPTVYLTAPQSTTIWQGGSEHTVEWSASDANLVTNPITLAYSLDDGTHWTSLATALANTGTYSWTTPITSTTQARVHIEAVDSVGNVGSTTISAFTLDNPPLLSGVSSTLALVKQGTPVTITTTDASDPDGDLLTLQCGTSSGNDDLGTGDYGPGERTLAFIAPWTDNLDHIVWCVVTDGILNSTEHTTTITADNTLPTISLATPQSTTIWQGGSEYAIEWSASDANLTTNPITLAYSLDDGAHWTSLAAALANTGTYSWTPPITSTTQARVHIEAVDLAGKVGSTNTLTFTLDNPPNPPTTPIPAVGASGVPLDTTLSWTCTDPNGDPLTYDIYFGTNATPLRIESGWSTTNYTPTSLQPRTTYYWRIVSSDGLLDTQGDLWNFGTVQTPTHTIYLPLLLKHSVGAAHSASSTGPETSSPTTSYPRP
ncbi:MAG: hypothetical protein GY832_05590 [Chloroflexi bacterium]|nr:hypothetical protein [Chloroflexota bacterium]